MIWAAGAVVIAVMVTAGVAAGERHGGLPARMLSGHGVGGAVHFAENGGRVINPSVIAAVGSHVWIPDGRTSITVLTDH